MQIVDYDKLEATVDSQHDAFASATPYPHIVLDEFLDETAANALLDEFGVEDGWTYYNHYNERKMGLTAFDRMGPKTQEIIRELSSPRFLAFLSDLSGIDNLIADPALDGGGLHKILPGGYLNIHADFQSHTTQPEWSRQLNLLLYLNKDWESAWGGNLELWNENVSEMIQSFEPKFNRCVLFHTTATSMHGHPTPLTCPEGSSRNSLALYYFRDEGEAQSLSPTNYRARPEDSNLKHGLVVADRWALRTYSFLKRYTPLSDAFVSRILKRFSP